jgi:hypothetical protein
MDRCAEQQSSDSETVRQVWLSSFASIRKEEVCLHAFGLSTLAWRMVICYEVASPLFVKCGLCLTILHTLLEFPDYDEDRREFSLQGTLSDIHGENCGNVFNIVAFLCGTGVDKYNYA